MQLFITHRNFVFHGYVHRRGEEAMLPKAAVLANDLGNFESEKDGALPVRAQHCSCHPRKPRGRSWGGRETGASGNDGGWGRGRGEKEKGRKEPLGTNRVKTVQPPPLRHDADRA